MSKKFLFLVFAILLALPLALAVFPLGSVVMMLPHANISSEWIPTNGQLLPIFQNLELFSIVGNAYGGNGVSTFAVPDLRATFIVASSEGPNQFLPPGIPNRALGDRSGSETISLNIDQMPSHNHDFYLSSLAATSTVAVAGAALSSLSPASAQPSANTSFLSMSHLTIAGSGQPFDNMPPYVAVAYFICINVSGCARGGIPVGLIIPNIDNFTATTEGETGGWLPASGLLLPQFSHPTLCDIAAQVNLTNGLNACSVPNIGGKTPIGYTQPSGAPGRSPRPLLSVGGSDSVLLTPVHLPLHTHAISASLNSSLAPGPSIRAISTQKFCIPTSTRFATLASEVIGLAGSNNSRVNIETPSAAVSYIICVREGGCGFKLPLGTLLTDSSLDPSRLDAVWRVPDGSSVNITTNGGLFNIPSQYWGAVARVDQTFQLPELRGRVLFGASDDPSPPNRPLGTFFGQETVTLSATQLPEHTHRIQVSLDIGTALNCQNNLLAATTVMGGGSNIYTSGSLNLQVGDPETIRRSGGANSVDLRKPSLVLNQVLCTDDRGCSSGECTACGCTPPFVGAVCGSSGVWVVDSASSTNSSGGSTFVVLSAPVISTQNLTIVNSSTVYFTEGISSITVVNGCINFGSDTSLVLNLNASTFAALQQQLIDLPYQEATVATNITTRCVSGTFSTIAVSNGLSPEASKCHNAVVRQTGTILSVVFDPNFSDGCEAPPSTNSTSGPASPLSGTNGIDSPASLNIALIASVSVVVGLVVIFVVIVLTVPPIRKRLLPMLPYNQTQLPARGSTSVPMPTQ
eukprot:TRINITY_DN4995_c0_g1_i1.p1 TRINITY_DN4995_c0_g1~~TRINITY_DN4995_c0_g1_i1.p1  ORF type:complete len:802 (+),score=67.09 TRINITY_DN4995_c0_g1_i1:33-2438(+)